ncbi:MAG: GNAT family N-acetyltransferase [Planctomycetes bacterium]|nr:GNAT family N-acetyltransferase [Planctomycetota bacterium]
MTEEDAPNRRPDRDRSHCPEPQGRRVAGASARIVPATDMDVVRMLFREYAGELGVDLTFQSFDDELASLPGKYADPDGAILVAMADGDAAAGTVYAAGKANISRSTGTVLMDNLAETARAAGVVALRRHDESAAEMKRLYVRPEYRGTGTGRRLVEALIVTATERGYKAIVLDTLRSLTASVALYRSLGFRDGPPHYHNPHPDAVYMRRSLPDRGNE